MKHLLQNAKHEIEHLRRENAILAAKVEVVNIFGAALLGPKQPMGMSPDVVWALDQEIRKLDTPVAAPFGGQPIGTLVDRFLSWPVPADVYPDGIAGKPGRSGTNLLTADQARQMLEHVLGG